jgi:hypothetical protein
MYYAYLELIGGLVEGDVPLNPCALIDEVDLDPGRGFEAEVEEWEEVTVHCPEVKVSETHGKV